MTADGGFNHTVESGWKHDLGWLGCCGGNGGSGGGSGTNYQGREGSSGGNGLTGGFGCSTTRKTFRRIAEYGLKPGSGGVGGDIYASDRKPYVVLGGGGAGGLIVDFDSQVTRRAMAANGEGEGCGFGGIGYGAGGGSGGKNTTFDFEWGSNGGCGADGCVCLIFID